MMMKLRKKIKIKNQKEKEKKGTYFTIHMNSEVGKLQLTSFNTEQNYGFNSYWSKKSMIICTLTYTKVN